MNRRTESKLPLSESKSVIILNWLGLIIASAIINMKNTIRYVNKERILSDNYPAPLLKVVLLIGLKLFPHFSY